MCAASEQSNLETIHGRCDGAGPSTYLSPGTDNPMMYKDDVSFQKFLEQPVVDHRLGSGSGFLGWLEHHHEGALPAFALLSHQGGRPHEPRDVHVVAARVHHRNGRAFGIGRLDSACVVDACGFLYW